MERHIFERVAELLEARLPAVLVTQVAVEGPAPREAGARMIVHADGTTEGTIGGGALEHRATHEAQKLLERQATSLLTTYELVELGMVCGGRATLLYEALSPQPRLVVFGAGHVGTALAELATQATQMALEIHDDRAERAKTSIGRAVVSHLPGYPPTPRFDADTMVVICTDSHTSDLAVAAQVLASEPLPTYIGLLGSLPKSEEFRKRLRTQGIPPDVLEHLHCPVGLPIGGKNPGEIALSILAELVAFQHGRLVEARTRLALR